MLLKDFEVLDLNPAFVFLNSQFSKHQFRMNFLKS